MRWRVPAALLGVQALAVAVWWAVEQARAPVAPFAYEVVDEPLPALPVALDAPTVVHFWATWCAPCTAELPSLLAAARDEGVPLVAVTEEPAAVVERWFAGEVPPEVVAGAEGSAERWGVSGLPDTFAVVGGRVAFRIGGPRDWSTPEARRWLRRVGRTEGP